MKGSALMSDVIKTVSIKPECAAEAFNHLAQYGFRYQIAEFIDKFVTGPFENKHFAGSDLISFVQGTFFNEDCQVRARMMDDGAIRFVFTGKEPETDGIKWERSETLDENHYYINKNDKENIFLWGIKTDNYECYRESRIPLNLMYFSEEEFRKRHGERVVISIMRYISKDNEKFFHYRFLNFLSKETGESGV